HPLLRHQPVRLQDIARYPMVMLAPGSVTRQRVEQALKEVGATPEIVLEIDTTQTLKRYVEFDLGVSVCSDFTLQPEDYPKLGVIPLDHLFPSSAIGVCTLQGKFIGRALQAFIRTLADDLSGSNSGQWNSPAQDSL
ncbi:MAG: LysR family transcriptional regulator substrate-binding protein, partial [Dehalococcoidia bacterium]